jgi:hypothetical protein
MTSSPGPQSKVEGVFEVIKVTDIRGKDLNDILLIDDGGAQDSNDSRSGVRTVPSFWGDIIDFLGSERGKDCREGDDEARCIEGIFFDAAVK